VNLSSNIHGDYKECMSKLVFINTLVLWNTPKALLQGKFPPDDSPWKHTVRKVGFQSRDNTSSHRLTHSY